MTSHRTAGPAPVISAAELPSPVLAAGRYDNAGRLVRVVHQPWLEPSTVQLAVAQLQAGR